MADRHVQPVAQPKPTRWVLLRYVVALAGGAAAGWVHVAWRLGLAIEILLGAFSIPAAVLTAVAFLVGNVASSHLVLAPIVTTLSSATVAALAITLYRWKSRSRYAWLTTRVRLLIMVAASMSVAAASYGAMPDSTWASLGDWSRTWLGLIAGVATGFAALDLPRRSRPTDRSLWVALSVALSAATLLGTVDVWSSSDDRTLVSIVDTTSFGLVSNISVTMSAINDKTASQDLGFGPDGASREELQQLLELTVGGHENIKVAEITAVTPNAPLRTVATTSTLGTEATSALTNMLQGSPAALQQAATVGSLTYVGLLGLPFAAGGQEPFIVMAAPILAPSSEARTASTVNVVVVAISLSTSLDAAIRGATGHGDAAFIDLYVTTPDGLSHVWSTDPNDNSLSTPDQGFSLTAAPIDHPSVQRVTPAFAGTDMLLVARRSPGLGLPLRWRHLILAIEGIFGGLLTAGVVTGVERGQRRERERLRRESLLAAALAGSPGWTAIIGPSFEVVMSNEGRAGVTAGMALADVDLFSEVDARRTVEDIIVAARSGEPGSYQLVWTDPDDPSRAIRIFEIDARPLPDPSLVHLQCRDVTEHRDRAMRSAQSERMEAIGVLAGGLAHDFNNLLFITLGYLQMLERQPLISDDPTANAYVARAIEAVERGATVAKSLLSVARSQPLTATPINLAEFLDGIRPLFDQAMRGAHDIEFNADSDGLDVIVDPGRLSSSLLNIAFNARDAMTGKGLLSISARHVLAAPPDGDLRPMVAISMRDNGKGMPAEVAARAFEPFFTTKKIGSGTGLGLSTVYSFAQQSGGWASIESTEGLGTTVTVFLPPALEHPAHMTTETLPTTTSTRAMVVDDEPALAELVGAWLADLGMTVKTANSPEAAMKLAAEFKPELLVSDANLGAQIDGLELARLLVERNPALLVVFMTGFSDRIKALQAAGVAVLAKPFTAEDLVNTLSLHLGERLRKSGATGPDA